MGKAKRFNSYDSDVEDKRKIAQNYGLARQNLSGIGSSFRSSPLSPITSSSNPDAFSSGADNLGNHLATQDLDMNGNDILLSSDQTTKINVTGTTALFLSAGSEVFRIGSTELQMAKQIDMNINEMIGITRIVFDVDADSYIAGDNYSSIPDDDIQIFTGGGLRMKVVNAGVTISDKLTVLGDSDLGLSNSDTITIKGKIDATYGINLGGGGRIKSNDSTELGIFIKNETGTVGTEGTVQIPEGTSTTAPTNTQLDGTFGAFTGAVGLFRDTDTTAGSRFYIRGSDGNWYYSFLTQQT